MYKVVQLLIVSALLLSLNTKAQTPRVAIIDSMKYERAFNILIYQDSLLLVCGETSSHGILCTFDKDLHLKYYVIDGTAFHTTFKDELQQSDTIIFFGTSSNPYVGNGVEGLISKYYNNAPIGSYRFGGGKYDAFITGGQIGSCYYGIGVTESFSEDQVADITARDYYVCKSSNNGEIVWQGVYGTEQKDELADAVITRNGSQILLAGANKYYHSNTSNEFQDSSHLFFVLLDTNGTELSRHKIRFSGYESLSSVCLAEGDGFYFTGGTMRTGTFTFYPITSKLDEVGDTSWIKRLWTDSLPFNTPENKQWYSYNPYSLKVLNNGDLLLSGIRYLYPSTHTDAFVARFTATGDSVWCYNYRTDGYDYFRDAIEDERGYIYVCGYTITPVTQLSATYDIVLLKLDANGCVMDTCLMPELPIEQPPIPNNTLFPNPFSSTLNIYHEADSTNEPITCNVFNSIGQLINHYSWTSTSQPVSIDTNNWSKGFYIVEIKANGLVDRMKAVKQ